MKTKTIFFLLIAAILAALLLSGCGGSKSQTVNTPWDGSVAGVDTLPPDDDTDVEVTTWISVFWPDRYFEPSQTFTFRLYRWNGDSWDIVRTVDKDSFPDRGEWWFAPEDDLSYGTDYRIVITDDFGGSHTHYFTTEYARSRAVASGKKYMPQGGGKEGGTAADEHVIKVPAAEK